jgi:hypothetical protein
LEESPKRPQGCRVGRREEAVLVSTGPI